MKYFLLCILTENSWISYMRGFRDQWSDTYPPCAEGAD